MSEPTPPNQHDPTDYDLFTDIGKFGPFGDSWKEVPVNVVRIYTRMIMYAVKNWRQSAAFILFIIVAAAVPYGLVWAIALLVDLIF